MNTSQTSEPKTWELRLVERLTGWVKAHPVRAGLAFALVLFLTVLDPRLALGVGFIAWLRAHPNSALAAGLLIGLALWAMDTATPALPLL